MRSHRYIVWSCFEIHSFLQILCPISARLNFKMRRSHQAYSYLPKFKLCRIVTQMPFCCSRLLPSVHIARAPTTQLTPIHPDLSAHSLRLPLSSLKLFVDFLLMPPSHSGHHGANKNCNTPVISSVWMSFVPPGFSSLSRN
jgi:hypothetical protein